LVNHDDWCSWFVISSSLPPICNPNFSFIGGVEFLKKEKKKKKTKLGCEKFVFLPKDHILGTSGDAALIIIIIA
jgi:hypothetical protein